MIASWPGILAQRVPDRDAVVVGLGLNVGWAPQGAAALATGPSGRAVAPVDVLAALVGRVDRSCRPTSARRYRDALVTLGRWVRVELPGRSEPLHGRAVDVDDDGRLTVIDVDGVRHDLDVGDVVHVRAAPSPAKGEDPV